MRTVIVFYSLFGMTKTVAEKLAIDLWFDLVEIKTENEIKKFNLGSLLAMTIRGKLNLPQRLMPIDAELSEYDCIIFGIPWFYGQCANPMRMFIKQFKVVNKNVGYFIVGNKPAHKAHDELKLFLKNNIVFLATSFNDIGPDFDNAIHRLKGQICQSMMKLFRQ